MCLRISSDGCHDDILYITYVAAWCSVCDCLNYLLFPFTPNVAQFEDHINYPETYTEPFTATHPKYPAVFQFCTLRIETLDPYISRHKMDVE